MASSMTKPAADQVQLIVVIKEPRPCVARPSRSSREPGNLDLEVKSNFMKSNFSMLAHFFRCDMAPTLVLLGATLSHCEIFLSKKNPKFIDLISFRGQKSFGHLVPLWGEAGL